MHVQHDFHIRWCSCHLKITRLLPLVKQELFTFPEHVSPFRFSFGSCWLIFSFTWSVLWTIVSLSSVLLLIILSVLWLAAHHIVCPMIVRSSYCLSYDCPPYDCPLIILSVLWLAAHYIVRPMIARSSYCLSYDWPLIILSVLWLPAHHIVCPMIGRSSYCPSYDWPLLIIHLVSSNFSYILWKHDAQYVSVQSRTLLQKISTLCTGLDAWCRKWTGQWGVWMDRKVGRRHVFGLIRKVVKEFSKLTSK
jgi:hypothetical protein